MKDYKLKAVEEVKNFLVRSEEEIENFIAKVQVFENVLTVDFATNDEEVKHEINVVLLAKTPQGIQVAYNNVISFTDAMSAEEVNEAIVNSFPTKEAIVAARKAAEEEATKKEAFQQQMQKLDPQELARMAAGQVGMPGEDTEAVEHAPELKQEENK